MDVDLKVRRFLANDDQVSALRFNIYVSKHHIYLVDLFQKNFIACKVNKCSSMEETEEMNDCVKACAKSIEFQQAYATHAYSEFSERFNTALLDRCLSKGKDVS